MLNTWFRNAGSKRLHKPASDWVRSGRAVCGRDIGRAGFAWDGNNANDAPVPHYTALSTYPNHFGTVHACKRCIARLERVS